MKKQFDFDATFNKLTNYKKSGNFAIVVKEIEQIKKEQFLSLKETKQIDELYDICSLLLKDENYKKYLNSLDQEQLIHECFHHNVFHIEVFEYFCDRFINCLTDQDFYLILSWLNNKNISNLNKFTILFLLKKSNYLDKQVSVTNHENKQFTFFLKDFHELLDLNPFYQEVVQIIENHFFKTPSLSNIGLNWLNQYYVNCFGTKPKFSANELAQSVIKQIEESFK